MQLHEIWGALLEDQRAIITVFIWIVWGALMIRAILGNEIDLLETVSLAGAGWVLPLFFFSLLLLALGTFWGFRLNFIWATGILIVSGALVTRHAQWKPHAPTLTLVGAALFFLIAVRLPFATKALLPSYFDSAEHYRIANVLIADYKNTSAGGNFISPVSSYYHLGYHIIVAALTVASQSRLERMMLVFGQIVLALTPLPLFAIVRRGTGSEAAGIFAVFLASFGWYMPAHAVNWGKYPALLSIPPMLFSCGILYLSKEYRGDVARRRLLIGMAVVAIVASFFIHTRSIFLIGMGIISYQLAGSWKRQSGVIQFAGLVLALVILTGEIVYVERNRILNPLFDPYLHNGFWITLIVAALSTFGFLGRQRLAFTSLLLIIFTISGLFIPVSTNAFFTLLDRPFIEMALFIPLTVLSGTGFASLNGIFGARLKTARAVVMVSILALVAIHAFTSYNFYPSNCCIVVNHNDLIAFDWISINLSQNARVAIASSEIKIAPWGMSPQNAGSDAGVWVGIFTNRQTLALPYYSDFRRDDVLENICALGVTHIYAGHGGQSFNRANLAQKPEWYEALLYFPGAQIYRVIGCDGFSH